ncbi:hypothetical protein LTR49_028765, partial [Elasticomyces elasticus]
MTPGQERRSQRIRQRTQAEAQQQIWFPGVEHDGRPDSPTLPKPHPTRKSITPPPATHGEAKPLPVEPVKRSTPALQIFQSQPRSTLPTERSTSPPARRRKADYRPTSYAQYSSPKPQPISSPLGCLASEVQRSIVSITPVVRLEGRQMNRDGNITGEEGGSIGNIHDRVLGDVDNGVADVYLVAKARESPIGHASTPTPFVQHARLKSPAVTKGRLEFPTYRPEAGAPTWQQQFLHSAQPGTMHEPQYRPVAASIRSQRSVIASVDVPSNAAAVELEVSGLSQEHEEALLPVIDLSEVFIPAPMVPARSLARPKTKS